MVQHHADTSKKSRTCCFNITNFFVVCFCFHFFHYLFLVGWFKKNQMNYNNCIIKNTNPISSKLVITILGGDHKEVEIIALIFLLLFWLPSKLTNLLRNYKILEAIFCFANKASGCKGPGTGGAKNCTAL